jgi:hypothetical protein
MIIANHKETTTLGKSYSKAPTVNDLEDLQ